MKRITSVVAAFALLSFASCKKEDAKSCYTCTLTSTMDGVDPTSIVQEYCDKSQSEIDAIQKSGNTSITTGPMTMTTKMNCVKK